MEDKMLIEQILAGDSGAIEELHTRYVDRIFNYIYLQTSNYHDAEELLQDVFFKVAKQLHTFAGKSSFETWIFKITRNTIIDYYRKNRKKQQSIATEHDVLDGMAGSEESAENIVMRDFRIDEVMVAFRQLPEHYRMVLYLRFIEGFSLKETARIMEKTTLSVKALQHRARKALFEQFESGVMNDA